MTPAVGGTEHAAWGSEYDLRTNEVRAMDVVSNSFCAGGIPLGNGTWLNGSVLLVLCARPGVLGLTLRAISLRWQSAATRPSPGAG